MFRDRSRSGRAGLAAGVLFAMTGTGLAGRPEPERVDLLVTKDGAPKECGIAADYMISGAILRIELAGVTSGDRVKILIRAYQPNSVGPIMSDIWLKTTTLFTPPNFKPARMNSNGILEASGEVERDTGIKTIKEIARGDAEVAIIFDGVLPTARLPVGLPRPLPAEISSAVDACADQLGSPR